MDEKLYLSKIKMLEANIAAADDVGKLTFQSELHKVIAEMRIAGIAVPLHLQELDEQLTDEATESRFDNLPI